MKTQIRVALLALVFVLALLLFCGCDTGENPAKTSSQTTTTEDTSQTTSQTSNEPASTSDTSKEPQEEEPHVHTWDAFNVCSICKASWAYNLEFLLLPDNTYAVVGIGTETATKLVIPASYKGKAVTLIAEHAFGAHPTLTQVELSETLLRIESFAFVSADTQTAALQTIRLPASVTEIEPFAFAGCNQLREITVSAQNPYYFASQNCLVSKTDKCLIQGCATSVIPTDGSVLQIANGAFYRQNELTAIALPSQVTKVGSLAFAYTGLREIVIAEGVQTLENGAFKGCASLERIALPASLKSIGPDAFRFCSVLYSVRFVDLQSEWVGIVGSGAEAIAQELDITDAIVNAVALKQGTYQAWIGPHTHVPTAVAAVEETCTKVGYTAGERCSVCLQYSTLPQEIPANGHASVADPAVAPKCLTTGLTAGSHCDVCGEVLVAQTIVPANGHITVVDQAVTPTCTEDGKTAGAHCMVCQIVLVAQTPVEAAGHTETTTPAVAPTCKETGLTEGSHCSVCLAVLTAQTVVPTVAHTPITDRAVAPTCT